MSDQRFIESLESRQLCSAWVGNAAMIGQVLWQSPARMAYSRLGHYGRGIEVMWRNTNLQNTPFRWMDANRRVY